MSLGFFATVKALLEQGDPFSKTHKNFLVTAGYIPVSFDGVGFEQCIQRK